jgi:hypothetical protein
MARDDELLRVAGDPLNDDEPLTRYSPDVPVTVYAPELLT